MTTTTISAFESTVHTTNKWLDELSRELGRDDRQQAYRVLRAVLFALRDRLRIEEATDLGAQLPLLVRGIYYESWNPSKTPVRRRSRQELLDDVAANLQPPVDGDPAKAARAVFALLARHVTTGEIEDVKGNLPADVRELWP